MLYKCFLFAGITVALYGHRYERPPWFQRPPVVTPAGGRGRYTLCAIKWAAGEQRAARLCRLLTLLITRVCPQAANLTSWLPTSYHTMIAPLK